MADKSVTFDILARDRASKAFDSAGKSSGKLHGALVKVGGLGMKAVAGGALAAGAAIGGLGAFLIQGVKDAASYQTLQAKTAAVLKSTGNAAGTSVKAIQAHAASLESLSGVDEELYINSQNVLATFTGVQNKVGKGNQIFDRATVAIGDMSAALGTDLQASTIHVGKALNDPIKGITALQRVGVNFTKSQKDQIKAMVESGNKMGAQKLILAELNKEFGGAAKAAGSGFAGSLARAKDALSDAGRAIGQQLLPHVTKLADWLATKGIPATIAWAKETGPKLVPVLKAAGSAVKALWHGATALWNGLKAGYQAALPLLRLAMNNVKAAIKDVTSSGVNFKAWMSATMPILKVFGAIILTVIVVAIIQMSAAIRVAGFAFKNILVPGLRFALSTVGSFLGGIRALAGAMSHLPGPMGAPWRAMIGPLDSAIRKVRELQRAINAVPRRRNVAFTVTVNGKRSTVIQRPDGSVSVGSHTARAAGGPVSAGQPYVVGEHRPELFVPAQSGRILPRVPGGGGGGNVTVYVTVASALASKRDIATAVTDAIASAKAGGWTPPRGWAAA